MILQYIPVISGERMMIGEYDLKELGKRIQTARKSKKKTQDDVAHAIGVSKNIISEWERGVTQPGLLNILNYCHILDMTLDEVFDLHKTRSLTIHLTTEERDAILAILTKCKQETDMTNLHEKIEVLEYSLKAFFSRAESK